MLHLLTKWHPEDDPISREQAEVLFSLTAGALTEKAMEGFLVVCSRFVDELGHHRTAELGQIFRTDRPEGKRALVESLEFMTDWVGGMDGYLRSYPVTIIPPRPAFPQFKILGIDTLAPRLYRVLDSNAVVYPSDEPIKDYIQRIGRLPAMPKQTRPVRRTKPRFHWCSYEKWACPETTREALQILPNWSDCRLRANILTEHVKKSAFVAFNGDRQDPTDDTLKFYKYYYEPLAQDHPPHIGGGPQIVLDGAPKVETLEQWHPVNHTWETIWTHPKR